MGMDQKHAGADSRNQVVTRTLWQLVSRQWGLAQPPGDHAMTQITTNDAAARLGISRTRVLTFIKAGRLAASKIGRDHLIEEGDLEQFAVRVRTAGRPESPDAKPASVKRRESRHAASRS